MDLSKSYEFFDPSLAKGRVHIVGCGSVGSALAENIARLGVKKFDLWDFDVVEPHNIVNQQFTRNDVGKLKVEAVKELIESINDEAEVRVHPEGWQGETMSGYLFLAVDSIEIRKQICEAHKMNFAVKAVFDCRTGLTDAQHYAADWSKSEERDAIIASMQFSHEEAKEDTPVSACGITLGVVTTVRLVVCMCVNNFVNLLKGNGNWKFVYCDGFAGRLECI